MLRRIARLFLYLLAVVVLMVVGGFAYLFLAFPRTAPPALVEAPRTPERIARGQYPSRHVVGCSDCHGERDWTRYSAPQMREREGHGGMAFPRHRNALRLNITPVRLSTWTDGEVPRAMTSGVSKDGSPLPADALLRVPGHVAGRRRVRHRLHPHTAAGRTRRAAIANQFPAQPDRSHDPLAGSPTSGESAGSVGSPGIRQVSDDDSELCKLPHEDGTRAAGAGNGLCRRTGVPNAIGRRA